MTKERINQAIAALMGALMFAGASDLIPSDASRWIMFAAGLVGIVSGAFGFNTPGVAINNPFPRDLPQSR